jgi:hypothetical protein
MLYNTYNCWVFRVCPSSGILKKFLEKTTFQKLNQFAASGEGGDTYCVWSFKKKLVYGGGVQLGPLGTAASNRPIVPAPGDYDDGKIGGMIGRGNRSTRRKPPPVPLCPPQTTHAARMRTRAASVGSQRLTA